MMLLLPDDIAELVGSEKRLAARPKWDARSDPRYFVFTAPLVVANVMMGGFELRAKVSR